MLSTYEEYGKNKDILGSSYKNPLFQSCTLLARVSPLAKGAIFFPLPLSPCRPRHVVIQLFPTEGGQHLFSDLAGAQNTGSKAFGILFSSSNIRPEAVQQRQQLWVCFTLLPGPPQWPTTIFRSDLEGRRIGDEILANLIGIALQNVVDFGRL
mmetsp:Transcript_37572/g.61226  ORF Transcript_37572/g.61226 Transcript_37572/m.61226 type:complete len:153 (-) Transcript_37572:7-465(-)